MMCHFHFSNTSPDLAAVKRLAQGYRIVEDMEWGESDGEDTAETPSCEKTPISMMTENR